MKTNQQTFENRLEDQGGYSAFFISAALQHDHERRDSDNVKELDFEHRPIPNWVA